MDIIDKIDNLLIESESVANEIIRQIRALDSHALIAWGAKEFVSSVDALRFRVSTPSFKGIVRIILNDDDTYTIEKATIKKLVYTVLDKREGIYVDRLVKEIDSLVD